MSSRIQCGYKLSELFGAAEKGSLIFKGIIFVPSDFPTLAEVKVGWMYFAGANVTDNDVTKTNTGQSFLAGDEIIWNGTNWTLVGANALWGDNLTNLLPINPRNIDIATGKVYKINNENIFTRSNPELNTTDKAVFGSINELDTRFKDGLQHPTGFSDISKSEFFYNPTTRQITIQPKAPALSFDYYLGAVKYTVSTPQLLTHAATTGTWYFYWDETNTLRLTLTSYNIRKDVLISYIQYNLSLVDGFAHEERHSSTRNPSAHLQEHETVGSYVAELTTDFIAADYIEQPVTPVDNNNTFSLSNGTIADEDLRTVLGALANNGPYTVLWRTGSGTEWVWDKTLTVPFKSGTYIQYNHVVTSNWVLTDIASNQYINVWVIKNPSIDTDFQTLIIQPQAVYSTLVGAQSETLDNLNFEGLNIIEGVQIYKFTYQSLAAYTTTGKVRIETVERLSGKNIRITQAGVTEHNALAGKQLAALGVTWGHLSDQLQEIAGEKSFTDPLVAKDKVKTEFIEELTPGAGVDIEGVDFEDGNITIGFFPSQLFFGPAASAPAGWYHLNSSAGTNVIDSSGFGLNLTTVNMVDGDWVPGLLNNCLQFAATKYAQASFQTDLSFDNTDAFSFECWVNNSDVTAQIIFSKMSQIAPNRGYQIVQNATTGKLNFSLRNDVATNQISVDGNIGIADGTWNHVVITYDGSSDASGVKIYVNSILNTNTVNVNTLTATTITTTKFQISGRDTTTLNYLGKIDEFVVYPRVVDQAFITQRYNSGVGTEVIPGFLNRGSLNVNSITGKMTQLYGGDFELICSASSSKILFTPPSDGGVEITDGEYFKWMTGITAARPASPANGMVRYNSTTNRNEFYENGVWENYLTESLENLWDRSGTDLIPHNSGDSVVLGAGDLSALNVSAVLGADVAGLAPGFLLLRSASTIISADNIFAQIANWKSAPSMIGTETSIQIQQKGENTTLQDMGYLTWGTETNWDLAPTTRDGYFDFYLTRKGVKTKAYSIVTDPVYTSDHLIKIEGGLVVNANSAYPITLDNIHTANQILMTCGTTLFTVVSSCFIDQDLRSANTQTWLGLNLTHTTPASGLTINLATPLSTYESGIGVDNNNKFIYNTDAGGTGIYSADSIMLMLDSNNDTTTTAKLSVRANATTYAGGIEVFSVTENARALLKSPAGASGNFSLFTIDTTDLDDQSALHFSKAGVRQWQLGSRNELDVSDQNRLSIFNAASSEVFTMLQNGNVGINVASPTAAKLSVNQSSTVAAIPTLNLTQADVSEGFVDLIGSDRSTVATSTTDSTASARVELNGVVYVIPLFADQ